jgi:hypothetical protein
VLEVKHIQKLKHSSTKISRIFVEKIYHIEFLGHFEFLRKNPNLNNLEKVSKNN